MQSILERRSKMYAAYLVVTGCHATSRIMELAFGVLHLIHVIYLDTGMSLVAPVTVICFFLHSCSLSCKCVDS